VFRNTLYKRRTQKMYETVVSVISQASLWRVSAYMIRKVNVLS
jgi:hypothetical protein